MYSKKQKKKLSSFETASFYFTIFKSQGIVGSFFKCPFSTYSGELILFVNNPPVPKPCGIELFKVYVHCAIALKPILLSKAELIQQPISNISAISIHSSYPLYPPTKLCVSMMYCG